MNFVLHPWQFYLVILAGWINRQQQFVIEYLCTENRVLWEKFGRKRILLTDDQRRRLAVKGKFLGRSMLAEFATLFAPDAILRWHRELVARKCDHSEKRNPSVQLRPRSPVSRTRELFQIWHRFCIGPGSAKSQLLPRIQNQCSPFSDDRTRSVAERNIRVH